MYHVRVPSCVCVCVCVCVYVHARSRLFLSSGERCFCFNSHKAPPPPPSSHSQPLLHHSLPLTRGAAFAPKITPTSPLTPSWPPRSEIATSGQQVKAWASTRSVVTGTAESLALQRRPRWLRGRSLLSRSMVRRPPRKREIWGSSHTHSSPSLASPSLCFHRLVVLMVKGGRGGW